MTRSIELRIDTSVVPRLRSESSDPTCETPCLSAPPVTTAAHEGIDALFSESRTLLRYRRPRQHGSMILRSGGTRGQRSHPYAHRVGGRIPLQPLVQQIHRSFNPFGGHETRVRQYYHSDEQRPHRRQSYRGGQQQQPKSPDTLRNVQKHPWLDFQSFYVKSDPNDVEKTMHLMDKYYHASFYEFVRNEEHALCISRHLRPIVHKYSIHRLVHGLTWIIRGWSFDSCVILLRHLTHGWNIGGKAHFFRVFLSKTTFLIGNQIELIHVLLANELVDNAAIFLCVFTKNWSHRDITRWICLWDRQSSWNYQQFCEFVHQFIRLKFETHQSPFTESSCEFYELKAALLSIRLPQIYLPLTINGFLPSAMMMPYPVELRQQDFIVSPVAIENKENWPQEYVYRLYNSYSS